MSDDFYEKAPSDLLLTSVESEKEKSLQHLKISMNS